MPCASLVVRVSFHFPTPSPRVPDRQDLEGLSSRASADSAETVAPTADDSESMRIDDLVPHAPSRQEYEQEIRTTARCEDFELIDANAVDADCFHDWVRVERADATVSERQ